MAGVDRRIGAKSVSGMMSKWSDVEEAYDYWVDRLRLRLAKARAR